MKTKKRTIHFASLVGFVLLLFLSNRCYYDSKEFLFPELTNLCDTTNSTFSGTVQPILSQYCLSCHSNTNASSLGGNIKLEDYADVLIQAQKGSLVGTITYASGYSPMPKGTSQLNECITSGVELWVLEGSQDN